MSNPNFDLTKFDYAPWYTGSGMDTDANVGKYAKSIDVTGVNGNATPMIDTLKDKIFALQQYVAEYTIAHDRMYRANADNTQAIKATASGDALDNSSENKLILSQLKTNINIAVRDINATIAEITPMGDGNRMAMDSNVMKLLQINQELQDTYVEMEDKAQAPILLEGNYQAAKIKTSANFYTYIFYLLFAIFIFVSLIIIYRNPEAGNLDMFILVLAVIIIIYYLYDYYVKKKRSKK